VAFKAFVVLHLFCYLATKPLCFSPGLFSVQEYFSDEKGVVLYIFHGKKKSSHGDVIITTLHITYKSKYYQMKLLSS